MTTKQRKNLVFLIATILVLVGVVLVIDWTNPPGFTLTEVEQEPLPEPVTLYV